LDSPSKGTRVVTGRSANACSPMRLRSPTTARTGGGVGAMVVAARAVSHLSVEPGSTPASPDAGGADPDHVPTGAGREPPRHLTSMDNLAATLRDLGDFQGARELQEHTPTARRRVLREDHPNTRASKSNLAQVRRELETVAIVRRSLASSLSRSSESQSSQMIEASRPLGASRSTTHVSSRHGTGTRGPDHRTDPKA
jgi:Tetratricopeptide repeat